MSDRDAHNRIERTPAVLSKKQRKLLLDGYDSSTPKHRASMSRIRDRLRSPVLDLSLVVERLEVAEISKTLAEREMVSNRDPYTNGLIDTLAFVYLAQDNREKGEQDEGWVFQATAASGIKKALHRRGVTVRELDLSLDIDCGRTLDQLHENLSDASNKELADMVQDGEISTRVYTTVMVERQRSETDDDDGGDGEGGDEE
jgi:hypothetical protein